MRLLFPPTSDEWLFLGIITFLVIMLISIAELVRRLLNGNSEVTRKFVHILAGILMAFAPTVFYSGIPAIMISVLAIIVAFFSVRLGYLQSLHDTERMSYGTTFHPLAFLILVVLFWDGAPHILSISILILAIPDALAAIVGKHLRSVHYFVFSTDKKTIEGSSVMFLSTFICIMIFLWKGGYTSEYPWYTIAFVTALVVAAWELVCVNGLDNLTIPLSTAFMLHYFLVPGSHHLPLQMIAAVVLAAAIGAVAYYFKFLSGSGSIATFLLAVVIYGIGGWLWTVPILAFFIASSLLSKFGKARKKKLEQIFDKSNRRDAGQVAANGGIAGFLTLLWYMYPDHTELYYCYIASIAAVTADTWGTEIGTLLKRNPRSIVTFKTVDIGTSGGVSLAGFMGGAVGAGFVVVSAATIAGSHFESTYIIPLIISGCIGSIIDSILGATVQAQYQTTEGKRTEKTSVHGVPTSLMSGFVWINNDIVNWLCAASGAAMMYFLL
ncbi:MAG: DUF92 domain-containing protein [Bacteroidota bacterium]